MLQKLACVALALSILACPLTPLSAKTVSGVVTFENTAAQRPLERIVVRVESRENPKEFADISQELSIQPSDATSNQFNIEIGDPQGKFVISASCSNTLTADFWCPNYENNGSKAAFPAQARRFQGIENDISDLNIIISDVVELSGAVTFTGEEATNPTSVTVALSTVEDLGFPDFVDPATGQTVSLAYKAPQTNVRFDENQVVAPYTVKIPSNLSVNYNLLVSCSGCATTQIFDADDEGRLVPFGSNNSGRPKLVVVDSADQSQTFFLDAFTGPINISGQLKLVPGSEITEDLSVTLSAFASAKPNNIIAQQNYSIAVGTDSVPFSFANLVSDPSGSKFGFALTCSNCGDTTPSIAPAVLLNARQNHSNVTLMFEPAKNQLTITPLMLLLDD